MNAEAPLIILSLLCLVPSVIFFAKFIVLIWKDIKELSKSNETNEPPVCLTHPDIVKRVGFYVLFILSLTTGHSLLRTNAPYSLASLAREIPLSFISTFFKTSPTFIILLFDIYQNKKRSM